MQKSDARGDISDTPAGFALVFRPTLCSSRTSASRVHIWRAQSGHLQGREYKCIPGEHPVEAEECLGWIGREILLAGRKIGIDVDLGP